MSKRRVGSTHRPVCIYGRVVLEFFGNEDESFKNSEMLRLVKALRKELPVSAVNVEEQYVENPERATLVFSLVGPTIDHARRLQDEVLKFLDEMAPARLIDEEIQAVDI
ncbi:MAG: DUF503 family protein [Bdellovibrionales bacterium]|nr:DUF503 family protein [Bdellovibrionales bacterium]